jgi:hypothetical protein
VVGDVRLEQRWETVPVRPLAGLALDERGERAE